MKKNLVILSVLVLGVAALAQAQGQVPTKIAIIHVQNAILSTKDGQKAATDLQATVSPRQQDLEKKRN